jgi:hypothetical protein
VILDESSTIYISGLVFCVFLLISGSKWYGRVYSERRRASAASDDVAFNWPTTRTRRAVVVRLSMTDPTGIVLRILSVISVSILWTNYNNLLSFSTRDTIVRNTIMDPSHYLLLLVLQSLNETLHLLCHGIGNPATNLGDTFGCRWWIACAIYWNTLETGVGTTPPPSEQPQLKWKTLVRR